MCTALQRRFAEPSRQQAAHRMCTALHRRFAEASRQSASCPSRVHRFAEALPLCRGASQIRFNGSFGLHGGSVLSSARLVGAVEPVGGGRLAKRGEARQLRRLRGHDELAAAGVLHPMRVAEVIERPSTGHARPGLERARGVVDARVDHLAVARRGGGACAALALSASTAQHARWLTCSLGGAPTAVAFALLSHRWRPPLPKRAPRGLCAQELALRQGQPRRLRRRQSALAAAASHSLRQVAPPADV